MKKFFGFNKKNNNNLSNTNQPTTKEIFDKIFKDIVKLFEDKNIDVETMIISFIEKIQNSNQASDMSYVYSLLLSAINANWHPRQIKIIQLLLNAQDQTNKDLLSQQNTAILNSVMMRRPTIPNTIEICELLLKAHAKISASTSYNLSGPLHQAASLGIVELIDLFLQTGADINERGQNGNTALHCAVMNSQVKAVERLLNANAKVTCRNNSMQTPLEGIFHAPKMNRENNLSIAKLLLETGLFAGLLHDNKFYQMSPWDMARTGGHVEIIELFEEYEKTLTPTLSSLQNAPRPKTIEEKLAKQKIKIKKQSVEIKRQQFEIELLKSNFDRLMSRLDTQQKVDQNEAEIESMVNITQELR